MAAKLEFEHNLVEVLKSLKATDEQVRVLTTSLKAYTQSVSDGVAGAAKPVEGTLGTLSRMGKTSLGELGRSFKTFLGVQAIQAGLSISNQFKNTLSNTLKLSDAVRKLGDYYGVAEGKRAGFQASMGKALGERGLGMEVGAQTLLGLRGQGVKGEEALTQYAVSAGSLASVGGEQGSEGAIAAGLSDALRMRGIDSGNLVEMRRLSEAVNDSMQKTGTAATDILSNMTRLYSAMGQEQRRKMGPEAMAQLASIEAQVGPGATSFLEPVLTAQTKAEKERVKALGMGGLVTDKGLDTGAFKKFMAESQKLGGGDTATGLRARGLSREQVSAAMMLQERMPAVEADLGRARPGAGLDKQVGRTRGLQEASEAMQNRILGWFASPLATGSQGATELAQGLSESNMGSAAGVTGMAALSGGLISKGAGAVLGGAGGGTAAAAALPMLAAGGTGMAAGAAAQGIGQAQSPAWLQSMNVTFMRAFDAGFTKLERAFQKKEVTVTTAKDLKLTSQPTRGASQGPSR